MKHLLLSLLCASAFTYACSNKDDNTDPETDPEPDYDVTYQASDFIRDNLAAAKTTFQCQVSEEPTELTLDNGVKLTIPGGNVFTKNGVPITGAYTLEINTMLKPSEVLLSGTNTNYRGGGYLVTDGFFHVNVLQNNVSVDTNLSEFISISIPTDKADGTSTWIWEGDVEDGQFAWKEPGADVVSRSVVIGPNIIFANNKNFNFRFKKLGWYNCDVLPPGGNQTTVSAELTGQTGEFSSFWGGTGNTFVFFVVDSMLLQLYTEVNATTVQSYDNSIPVGMEGTLLAFSIKDGLYSYAAKKVKIIANLRETLNLLPVTKEELIAKLEELDK
ncbi:MAG: hypothetical protein LBK12_01200 [Odoribacteraceae bacterium]|nr:hypothetical protein [Odoribacteraceae bacterium]